jgi:hypothetical protein
LVGAFVVGGKKLGLDQRLAEAGAACLSEVLDAATITLLAADPVVIPLQDRLY